MDKSGRVYIPEEIRLALGIDGKKALLKIKVELVREIKEVKPCGKDIE